MDTLGTVYLVAAFVLIIAIDLALLRVAQQPPRGAALAFAFALMVLPALLISENSSRVLHMLEGSLRFAGFAGLFIGIYGLFSRQKK